MRLTVIIAALCLGACATTPAMDTALAPLTGQPVQLVLDQLGPPSSSTPAGTDTIYQWYSTKMVHGTPSSRFNGSASAPSEDAPTPGQFAGPPVPYTCDVRILADSEGRIKDSQFGEESGGCRESARKLRQLAYSEPR